MSESTDSTSRDGLDVTTLQTQKYRKWYTFKLHHRVLRESLHVVHLLLHQQTVVYIRIREVPKIAFSPPLSPSFAIRWTTLKTQTFCSMFI